jgi:hypothetical protein
MSLKNFVQQLTRLDWAGFKTANEGGAKLGTKQSIHKNSVGYSP